MAVYSELANSTYLDLTSYRGNAALPNSNLALTSFTVNVALVLDRANDPTALLSSPWATRQAALADQTAGALTAACRAANRRTRKKPDPTILMMPER